MKKTEIRMRTSNAGLTVKLNLWALKKYIGQFDSESARLWIKGEATNAGTLETKKFNDAGELLTALGKWNVAKFKEHKREGRKKLIFKVRRKPND